MSNNFLSKGREIEELFANTIDYLARTSTKDQDINGHYDIIVSAKIDVKSIKHTERIKSMNQNYHWVELKNVQGRKGSLYGDADYFAFETDFFFILVYKIKLQDWIADKCKAKEYSKIPDVYKLYTRPGKKDIITIIPTIDLCYLADRIIKKHEHSG
jgi:hypothetical protein